METRVYSLPVSPFEYSVVWASGCDDRGVHFVGVHQIADGGGEGREAGERKEEGREREEKAEVMLQAGTEASHNYRTVPYVSEQ